MKMNLKTLVLVLAAVSTTQVFAQEMLQDKLAKPPTTATIQANEKVLQELPFNDRQDYEDARRGRLVPFNTIIDANGNITDTRGKKDAWNMAQYAFEDSLPPQNAPRSVNPSLWREAQLNNFAGFFEVIPNAIYQVRGLDLSVMTLIMGNDHGTPCWIAIDPLVTAPASHAGLQLANNWLISKGQAARPVRVVIYTHSHIDHYGGILGVADTASINSGEVKIYAPEAFLEHAVNENVTAGTAMGRRATYMYGNLLFYKSPLSEVDAGLGKTTSSGSNNIIAPDTVDIIPSWASITRPAHRSICGIDIDFWYTPETEAPAEMMFYFPKYRTLCASELVTHTMHNVYSLRGAAVRDALSWSGYISQVIEVYGSSIEVLFASHHWPTWGNKNINLLLEKQRDLYKYLNDQTFRLFNQGYTMIEIGERVVLPDDLAKFWPNRQYYGTVNHNVKAIYQKSLGWFDGNPANLHPLPPQEAGVKYVEYMGGPKKLLKMAKADFDKGNYRWVATAVNHLVFADPNNMQARYLLADTYEQLGYQAESGPWRNFYLTGARELRDKNRVNLLQKGGDPIPNAQSMSQMSPSEYFQYLAIHLNGLAANGKDYTFYVQLKNDVLLMRGNQNPIWARLLLSNGALKAYTGEQPDANASKRYPTITINQSTMFDILMNGGDKGAEIFQAALRQGKASITGGTDRTRGEWSDFLRLLEKFEFWFNIVEP